MSCRRDVYIGTYSAFRHVQHAKKIGIPVGIINIGQTCADCLADFKVSGSGADPGGSLGSRDPPPEMYQRSQKSDVLV